MKKFLIIFGLVLGFASASYSAGDICCGEDKEACCAAYGRVYCPNDNTCRTRCRNVTPPACIGGCINPDGECCLWCPTVEVCAKMGKCQKIVNGCYDCVECPEPKCTNEGGVCCDSCPRVCPDGQCLTNVDGCYKCGECGDDDDDDDVDDDDDDDDDECDVPMVEKWSGDCCEEGPEPCCPSKEDCNCYPKKEECDCPLPNCINSEGTCCPECSTCTPEECPIPTGDGCYTCGECDTGAPDVCPEGTVRVKNYEDGIGVCGEVCCEKEENFSSYEYVDWEDPHWSIEGIATYDMFAAVNRVCCGGKTNYTHIELTYFSEETRGWSQNTTTSYAVSNNKGYYCAATTSDIILDPYMTRIEEYFYPSPSIYMTTAYEYYSDEDCPMIGGTCIHTSSSGDPQKAPGQCDWTDCF